MEVELLLEGYTDEIFIRRCFNVLGIEVGTVYGKQGIDYVKRKASAFAIRGNYSPILVLADFADMNAECVVEARLALSETEYPNALVRLAVREIESWLIASRRDLASYLGVSLASIPENPDEIQDPKQALVNIARTSRRPRIKQMFVPRVGISSVVGPGYVDGFNEFMANHWNLEDAMCASTSFRRFVTRVQDTFIE